jgi:hypothetical protein
MAKGLKIASKESSGILHDQSISNTQGGVGGIPQSATSTGVKTIKVQFRTAANVLHTAGYIISQKGKRDFLVANAVGAVNGATHSNASITYCTLVNLATPTAPSTMSITGYTTSNATFNVSRITSKHVYDWTPTKYRYRGDTNVATTTFANVATA